MRVPWLLSEEQLETFPQNVCLCDPEGARQGRPGYVLEAFAAPGKHQVDSRCQAQGVEAQEQLQVQVQVQGGAAGVAAQRSFWCLQMVKLDEEPQRLVYGGNVKMRSIL